MRAEILWCLHVVNSRQSFNSNTNISNFFATLFPDSEIAKKMHLSRTKISCTVNHGIAKYFHLILIDQIKKCEDYVICFDGALNKIAQKCQMDIVVRFFHNTKNEVITRYLSSEFLGSTKSEDILQSFLNGSSMFKRDDLLQVQTVNFIL